MISSCAKLHGKSGPALRNIRRYLSDSSARHRTEVLNAVAPGPVKRDTNNWGPRVGFAYSPDFKSGLLGTLLRSATSLRFAAVSASATTCCSTHLLAQVATRIIRGQQHRSSTGTAGRRGSIPDTAADDDTPTLTSTTTFVNIPSDTQNPTSTLSGVFPSSARSARTTSSSSDTPAIARITCSVRARTIPASSRKRRPTRSSRAAHQPTSQRARIPQDFAISRPHRAGQRILGSGRILLETTGNSVDTTACTCRSNGALPFGLRSSARTTPGARTSATARRSPMTAGSIERRLIRFQLAAIPQDFLNRRNEWARSALRPAASVHRSSTGIEIPGFRSRTLCCDQSRQWLAVERFHRTAIRTAVHDQTSAVDALWVTGASATSSAGAARLQSGRNHAEGSCNRTISGPSSIPLDGTGIVTAPHVTIRLRAPLRSSGTRCP